MNEEKKKAEDHKRGHRFRRLGILLVAAVVLVGLLAWKAGLFDSRSIDEKLAAIDAELAIPEAENAAVFYRRFFTDPNNAAILDGLSVFSPSAYVEPWASSEDPELAAELKKHRAFIQTLLDISEMQKACFPVYPKQGTDWWEMLSYMRRVTFILSSAAANDLAEGRADAAFSKYRCQLRLARQLEQQPVVIYNLVGMAIEAVASGNIRRAVMRQETTPEQLGSLETILAIPVDRIEGHADIAARVERLIEEKEWSQLSLTGKLKRWLIGRKIRAEQKRRQRLIHLRLEATRRATPILIALRRYKDKTGVWPETL
ncbi:MAG: hypothetical protein JSW59_08345, partial [Phycisphaerales bacterium]